ncbi:MAG: hypothetical protein ABJO67_15660 [Pseudoruegeria sp.]
MNTTAQSDVLQTAQVHFTPTGHALRVFGMRRSGNHGIINWVQRNIDTGETVFLNNCRFGDPLIMFQSVTHAKGTSERRILNVDNHPKMRTAIAQWNTAEHHIVSYENLTLTEVLTDPTTPSGRYSEDVIWQNILIYRRFLNWLASYLKLMQKKKSHPYRHILRDALWRYKAALKEIDMASDAHIIPILYDNWATDASYRMDCLNRINLPCVDNSLGEIARFGGGSSFSSEGQNSEEVVHAERWAEFVENGRFHKILNTVLEDKEFYTLIEKHFPDDITIAREIVT